MIEYPSLKQLANGYWYIFWDRHERETLKTKDKATAERRFALVIRDKRDGALVALAPKPDTHFSVFIKQYLEWRATGDGKARGTVINDGNILRSLLRFTGDKPMSHIRPRDIDAFHTHLRSVRSIKGHPLPAVRASTLNNYVRVLTTAFKRALRWGFITINPYEDVKQLSEDQAEAPFLSREDIEERFLPALRTYSEPFQNLMLMYLYTGARREELCKMTAGQVKRQGDRVYLDITKSKSHRARLVPVISEEALAVIGRLPKVGYLFPGCTKPNDMTAMAKRYQHLAPGYLEEVMGKLSFKEKTTLSVVKPGKKK
jgi:integrase